MKQVVQGETRHPREGWGIKRLWDSLTSLPKLQVCDPNEDHAVIGRVQHVMLKNEKLMQFYSRTGLGRAQILQMTRDQITNFVERAETNRRNEVAMPPPAIAAPQTVPAPRVVDTWGNA